MSNALFSLHGGKIRLDIYNDHIELTGTSGMSLLGKGGVNAIPLSQITSVQFMKASILSEGWLHFSVPGCQDMASNIYSAKRNRNAVVFSKSENNNAERAKNEIERLKRETLTTSTGSSADELIKLKQLLDVGVLTQAEFDKQKAQVLGT